MTNNPLNSDSDKKKKSKNMFRYYIIPLAILIASFVVVINPVGAILPWKKTSSTDATGAAATGAASWRSMLTVDPSNIVSLMVKHGGLVVSKSIDQDIKLLSEVCHAQEIQLNVMERKLVIHNFSIRFPSAEKDALKIGKVSLTWDSYRKPCVEVQVDDVEVLVEFFNLILTKSNWSQLKNYGFPPLFEEYYEGSDADDDEYESFLRIGSIDFSGDMKLILTSHPLDKELKHLDLNLDETFDPIDEKLKKLSDENLVTSGRRGCTTTQIQDLIQTHFGRVIQTAVAHTVENIIVDGGEGAKEKINTVVDATKRSITNYVEEAATIKRQQIEDAATVKRQQIEDKAKKRVQEWGDSLTQKSIFKKASAKLQKLQSLYEDEDESSEQDPAPEL